MQIRRLEPNDLPEVERVAYPIYYPFLWEPMDAFVKKVELYPEGCFVAIHDDKIIGYLYSHPWKFDSFVPLAAVIELPPDPDCYYIHDLAVDVNYRSLGVGKLLAEKAFETGYDRIKLVSVLNSHNFWGKLGFEIVEPVEYAPGIHGYIMVRKKRIGFPILFSA